MAVKPECSFSGCGRRRWAKSYCKVHFDQHAAGKKLTELPPPRVLAQRIRGGATGNCVVPLCVNPKKSAGLCHTHYELRRRGDRDWMRQLFRRCNGRVSNVTLNLRPLQSTWEELEAEIERTGKRIFQLANEILDEWAYRQRNGGQEPGTSRPVDRDAWRNTGWDPMEKA